MSLWTVLQKESRKEGLKKGNMKERTSIVKSMAGKGLAVDEIAELSDISTEEVLRILSVKPGE